MPFLPSLRAGASLLDVFKAFPETSKPLIEFHEVLLRGPSPLTDAERELIAAYVSGLNRCRYCHGVHTATAERLGVPQGAVQQLVDEFETADVPEKMKPISRYAEKLTRDPRGVSKAAAAAVFAAGGGETALHHTLPGTPPFHFLIRLSLRLG